MIESRFILEINEIIEILSYFRRGMTPFYLICVGIGQFDPFRKFSTQMLIIWVNFTEKVVNGQI